VTQAIVKALGHAKRRELVRLMVERAEPVSPAQASRELGEGVSALSYHFHCLCDAGLLCPASRRVSEGALEQYYKVKPAAVEDPVVAALLVAP
jgi:predicted transcriptional regulator